MHSFVAQYFKPPRYWVGVSKRTLDKGAAIGDEKKVSQSEISAAHHHIYKMHIVVNRTYSPCPTH